MNAINALRQETRSASILRDELLRRFPALAEDEQALADTLEGEVDLDRAIAAVVAQVGEYETLAAAVGEQIKERQARKKRLEESADTMRAAILTAMEAAGMRKLTLPEATVSLTANSPAVVITDEEAAVAAGFCKTKVELDKAALRDRLKAGDSFDFALLGNAAPRLTIRRS